MIDLHCHSTCSDGVLSPAGLAALAAARRLRALALTDHDTVDGIDEFMAMSGGGDVELIPGVEIACVDGRNTIMHIVGLWIDAGDSALRSLLRGIRERRLDRNHLMLGKLRELSMPLDWAEVEIEAHGEVVGRPHFARALVRKAFCLDAKDAFTRFLGRGKAAYVARQLPRIEEILGLFKRMGAVAIWAHPLMSKSITGAKFRRICSRLIPMGLDGIETYYSDYTAHQTRTALAHAAHLGLLASGGSDYHGENVPGIELGVGRGDLAVPDALLGPLAARAAEKRRRASVDAAAVEEDV